MPFDDIYCKIYGNTDYKKSGEYQVSPYVFARFGKTKTEDSHSDFTFLGDRRWAIAPRYWVQGMDMQYPFFIFDIEHPKFTDGEPVAPMRTTSVVYGWPGVKGTYRDGTYGARETVDGMNIGSVSTMVQNAYRSKYSGITNNEILFECQNRESCHNFTNMPYIKNVENPFVGVHKEQPLEITADGNYYRGFYIVLERERFHYDEARIALWPYNQFNDSTGLYPPCRSMSVAGEYFPDGRTSFYSTKLFEFNVGATYALRYLVGIADKATCNKTTGIGCGTTPEGEKVDLQTFACNAQRHGYTENDKNNPDYGAQCYFKRNTLKEHIRLVAEDPVGKFGTTTRAQALADGFSTKIPLNGLNSDDVRQRLYGSYDYGNDFVDPWSKAENIWNNADAYDFRDLLTIWTWTRKAPGTQHSPKSISNITPAMEAEMFWFYWRTFGGHQFWYELNDSAPFLWDFAFCNGLGINKGPGPGPIRYEYAPGHSNSPGFAEIDVKDAVIHPDYSVRKQIETGNVWIKNITIKKGNTVLEAKNDIKGEYQEISSSEIWNGKGTTHITATSSGTGNKTITFSNLYKSKSNIISRYIATDFKIKFGSETTEYSIASVSSSSNTITLSTARGGKITNSSFTLLIPRGARGSGYTWGQYKLTNFDKDNFTNTNSTWLSIQYRSPKFGNNLHRDLFPNVEISNYSNWPSASGDVQNLNFYSLSNNYRTFEASKFGQTGKPVRHPYFANELGEALYLDNDFHHIAFWDRAYLRGSMPRYGFASCKIPGKKNVTWNGEKWVEYWERVFSPRSSSTWTETSVDATLNKAGYTNLAWTTSTGDGNYNEQALDGSPVNVYTPRFYMDGIDKASGSIWPNYRNILADIEDPEGVFPFDYDFPDRTDWTSKYTTAFSKVYGATGVPSIGKILDGPWCSFCSFKTDTNIEIWGTAEGQYFETNDPKTPYLYVWGSGVYEVTGAHARFALQSISSITGTYYTAESVVLNRNVRSTVYGIWQDIYKAKFEKTAMHPWVLALYGHGGDSTGWAEVEGGSKKHALTIYESNGFVLRGEKIQVMLHECPPLFCRQLEANTGMALSNDASNTSWGRSMHPVNRYRIYLVAK